MNETNEVVVRVCPRSKEKACHYCTRRASFVCPRAGCGRGVCGQCQRKGECRVHAMRGTTP